MTDPWFDWLLFRRHGGDPAVRDIAHGEAQRHAQRVLDGAGLQPGDTLLDIGTGEGVVAFAAIERAGPSVRAILADISQSLLQHAQQRAMQRGVHSQCSFVACGAEDLSVLRNASVDAVTSRAVLAYVGDKHAAFRECHRVLRPGGRLAIAEPIMRDEAQAIVAMNDVLTQRPGRDDAAISLLQRWKSAQLPGTPDSLAASPLTNFSERDLVDIALATGFKDVHLELHIDVRAYPPMAWSTFIQCSPHPLAPTLDEILSTRFTKEERDVFEQLVRPIAEAGRGETREYVAYLNAVKR